MTRTTARLGAITFALLLAGCLIKGPESPPPYYSVIRIYPNSNNRPPFGLLPAPAGHIYQFWAVDLDSSGNGANIIPLQRFQWNMEYFSALSENGDTLPLTIDPGLDLGINILDHDGLLVSIEPLTDPNPSQIDGPILMAALIDQYVKMNLEADLVTPLFQANLAGNSFSLIAQSLQYGVEGACWRSNSEGMGVWFATPIAKDKEVLDTVGLCMHPLTPGDTCATSIAKGTRFARHIKGVDYYVWIFPKHLDSSFSNFGLVFANQDPDLVFRDGEPQYIPGRTGPQMKLGENPMIRDGQTIGYIYYSRDASGQIKDTCYLRTDIPESTHCTSDPFVYYPFLDTNVIKRTFTTTWADTIVSSSVPGLPVLDNSFGLEYEAWIVFDSSTGTIPPLSLGRFSSKDGRDRSNPYTDTSNYDPHFNFPGEDLVHGLPRGLQSPLDLLAMVQDGHSIKIWITLEPVNDWAPAEPFRQLIVYSGEVTPDPELTSAQRDCRARTGESAPPVYSLPLTFREISASKASKNEGYNWPSMHFFLRLPKK